MSIPSRPTSTSRKGESRESFVSLKLRDKTPVLVSCMLMRRIGAGQIDFCYIEKGSLVLVEVKSSLTGCQAFGRKQKRRLAESANFLAAVTGMSVKIQVFLAKTKAPF